MTRGATSRLNEWGLAAQKSLFIRIENADERNLWEIETFSEQIDADKDVEIGRPQSPQDFHPLNRIDVAVQISYF